MANNENVRPRKYEMYQIWPWRLHRQLFYKAIYSIAKQQLGAPRKEPISFTFERATYSYIWQYFVRKAGAFSHELLVCPSCTFLLLLPDHPFTVQRPWMGRRERGGERNNGLNMRVKRTSKKPCVYHFQDLSFHLRNEKALHVVDGTIDIYGLFAWERAIYFSLLLPQFWVDGRKIRSMYGDVRVLLTNVVFKYILFKVWRKMLRLDS